MTTANENELKPIRAGVFTNVETADKAVAALLDAGFKKEQITVICSDKAKQEHFASFEQEGVAEKDEDVTLKSGALGGLVGGLVSLAGVATTGGLGIIAVGPILGGSVMGTLVGMFVGRGVENEMARFYDQAVTKGNLLIAVEIEAPDNQDRLATAAKVLRESGAEPFSLDEG